MCDSPFYVKNPRYPIHDKERLVPVPCGQCPPCQIRRVSHWSFRLLQEEKRSASAHFVTFSYDTEHVPITKNGFMSLKKKDFQDFMKRLRKLNPNQKLKYYCAGEYGTRRKRPHYHAIIFNVKDIDTYNEAWQLGAVYVGSVEGASINYTLKYINKGKLIPQFAKDDRIKEFSLMSKKMGENYLTPQIVKYHKNEEKTYLTIAGGIKISLPRYYREKIWSEEERLKLAKVAAQLAERKIELDLREYVKIYGTTTGYDKWKEEKALYRLKKHRKTASDRAD